MKHVMKQLFDLFEQEDIKYVHFKSNTNLDLSFSGKGDFDVLVESSSVHQIERLIASVGGKRFNTFRLGNYPGVDNWLVFDFTTGVYYHLHLHFQLDTGKALVKDYVIQLEELFFQTRVKDAKYDIYITNPNLELLLLSVRLIVKSKWNDSLRGLFKSYTMPRSMKEEYFNLREKIQQEILLDMIEKTFPEQYHKRVFEIIMEKDPLQKTFPEFQRIVRTTFKNNRRVNGTQASILSTYYSLRRKITQKVKNHSDCSVSIKKISLVSGNIIAFVGVDGAGKSTITKEIYKWLNHKVECRRFYLGTGSNNRSRFISIISSILKKMGGRSMESVEKSSFIDRLYWKSQIWNILNAERIIEKRIRAMHRYTLNGGVALLDRYPQIEMIGANDGPKIVAYREAFNNNRYIQKKIDKEKEYLSIVRTIKPDLVMRINISAETSMKRKPEQENVEVFQQKIEDLRLISFQQAKIVDIDGEQSIEKEIIEIKNNIWKII